MTRAAECSAGVAKAEWTKDEANPRSSSPRSPCEAGPLSLRKGLCAGDMENRIKECQLDLMPIAPRPPHVGSAPVVASMAYVLRAPAPHRPAPTPFAEAAHHVSSAQDGALVRVSARRIKVAMASTA